MLQKYEKETITANRISIIFHKKCRMTILFPSLPRYMLNKIKVDNEKDMLAKSDITDEICDEIANYLSFGYNVFC